jgi:hypothetical protein
VRKQTRERALTYIFGAKNEIQLFETQAAIKKNIYAHL